MKTILVVDDDENIRNLIRDALENHEYHIYEACDGDDACNIIKSNQFDLIITDIVMPNKNGIELIMDMIKLKLDTPIIAISGGGGITGRFDYLPIAKLIGAVYIIEKPFDISFFRKTIAQALVDRNASKDCAG